MALEARGYWLDRHDSKHPWGKGTGRKRRKHGKRAAIRDSARRGRAKGESVKHYAAERGWTKKRGEWVRSGAEVRAA